MPGMEWILELCLAGLLVATLFHAVRLERALGVLKRDRTALEALVAGFNASTTQAETSVARLRQAADGAGRDIARFFDRTGGAFGGSVGNIGAAGASFGGRGSGSGPNDGDGGCRRCRTPRA